MHKKNQSSKIKAHKSFPGFLLQNCMAYFLRWWTSVSNPWFNKTINVSIHLNSGDLSVNGREKWDNSLKLWATYSTSSIAMSNNKETLLQTTQRQGARLIVVSWPHHPTTYTETHTHATHHTCRRQNIHTNRR